MKRNALGTLVAVLALMLAGTGIASASAKPKVEIHNIIIGYAATNVSNTALYNGISLGIFAKYHLSVKLVGLGSSSVLVTAINANSITVGTVTPVGLIPAYAQGEPVQAISLFVNGLTLVPVISNAWASTHGITAKSTPEEVAKGLVGSIEVAGGTPVVGQVNVVMKGLGLTESQYSTVIVSNSAADVTLLASGKADWYFAGLPTPYLSVNNGSGFIAPLNAKTTAAYRIHQISSVVTANRLYAQANPALMKLVVRAIAAAVKYTAAHRQQSVSEMQTFLPGYTRSQLLRSILPLQYSATPLQNENIWRNSAAFAIQSGQIPPPISIKENGIWTNAYA